MSKKQPRIGTIIEIVLLVVLISFSAISNTQDCRELSQAKFAVGQLVEHRITFENYIVVEVLLCEADGGISYKVLSYDHWNNRKPSKMKQIELKITETD